MRKINLLFVILQMEMGGAERLVYDIIKGLDFNRFNPSVAWIFGKNEPLSEYKELNIPLYQIPKTGRIDFHTMKQFEVLINEKQIDIVNAHHFMSFVYLFYGCKVKNKIKLIYTEHSEWEIEKIGFKWRLLSKYLLGKIDKIVCVNDQITKLVEKKFNIYPPKVVTIRNGVVQLKNENSEYKEEIKREIGIEHGQKTIGIVANFRKVKNHIHLLKAFADLLKLYRNVKLIFIGQGFENDLENTEEQIRNFVVEKNINEYVRFLGYRNDVYRILSIIDIFCLVSLKEGTPISLLEAMSAGIPVIGTNVEGIKEIIQHGKNGYLVDVNSTNDLTNRLFKLLTNDEIRSTYGLKSKELANKNYSLEHCIRKYQNLFQEIYRMNLRPSL